MLHFGRSREGKSSQRLRVVLGLCLADESRVHLVALIRLAFYGRRKIFARRTDGRIFLVRVRNAAESPDDGGMVAGMDLLGPRRGPEEAGDAGLAFRVRILGEGKISGVRVAFAIKRGL